MLELALLYAELGYPVFPCAPNAKRPLTANGLLDATLDPARIEAYWADTPAANVAIRTDGLLVVDVDAGESGTANPWLSDQPEKLLDLAAAPISLTPRGGRHYVFRQPASRPFRNTTSKVAIQVDTRADGGYILAPPSVVGGKAYRWAGEARLDNTARHSLPEPPAWLMEALEGKTAGNLESVRADHAQAANSIPAGQRNSALTSLAGTMRRAGMSEAEILAALHKANADRCAPPLPDHDVDVIAWSVARYEPDPIAVAVAEDHAGQDGLTAPSDRGPGTFPKHLLRVPGFIGSAMAFNLAGARKAQPILALAGALCLSAVLTGRKITDPFGTRTNLYCLGVGASGCGKERARVVNKEILDEAILANRYREGIASHTGLVNYLAIHRETLFQVDEIGRLLRTLTHPNSAPHLTSIISVLMRLFTSSDSVFVTDTYADIKISQTIQQPHAVLYGTTVQKSLYEGFTEESVSDGFLSRILVFESEDPDPDPRPNVRTIGTPRELIEYARFWKDFKPPGWGNLSDESKSVPLVVGYSADAERRMAELEQLSRRERRACLTTGGVLWTRATEKAHKLALLYACSENHVAPLVGIAAANWAAELIEFLTRKMIRIAEEWIAETPFHSRRKRVLRAILAAEEGLSQTQLNRQTQYLTNRERTEILESLAATGDVRTVTMETNGRPRLVYVAA